MFGMQSPNVSPENQAERIQILFGEGITAAQNRKRRKACAQFWNVIEIDPYNTQAWLWLSFMVERPIDQIACLEIVLRIDPGNVRANDELARLTGVRRSVPAAVVEPATQVVEPSPPISQAPPVPSSEATQAETLEVTSAFVQTQPEQDLGERTSGPVNVIDAAQAAKLDDWVVRPPAGEKVLVLRGAEEKTVDPFELRRMQDYQLVMAKFNKHPFIRVISTDGSPPERYRLEYRVRGLTEEEGRISWRDIHTVEISLLLDYPRLRPICRMLTPAFHPNIDVDGTICIGDHWAASELLTSIMIQIAQILTYQSYNIRSPRNARAAHWSSENSNALPLQKTDFWE